MYRQEYTFIQHEKNLLECIVTTGERDGVPESIGLSLRIYKGEKIGRSFVSFRDMHGKCNDLPEEVVKEIEAFTKNQNKDGMYFEEMKILEGFRNQGYGEILRNMTLRAMDEVDSDYSFVSASPLSSELSLGTLVNFYKDAGYEVLHRYTTSDSALMLMKGKSQMNIGAINFVDSPADFFVYAPEEFIAESVDMDKIHARIEAKKASNNKLSLLDKAKKLFR